MAIDRSIIGNAAARFLDDQFEDKYGDEGTLSAVLTIVVIDHGPNQSVEYRAYNGTGDGLSGWQTKGLLAVVVGDDIQGSVRREHD